MKESKNSRLDPDNFNLEMEVDGVLPKLHFNRRDYDQLMRYREALELIFDHGYWLRVDREHYWIVPERYIEKVEKLTGKE